MVMRTGHLLTHLLLALYASAAATIWYLLVNAASR